MPLSEHLRTVLISGLQHNAALKSYVPTPIYSAYALSADVLSVVPDFDDRTFMYISWSPCP
jgi:hypothetical protein